MQRRDREGNRRFFLYGFVAVAGIVILFGYWAVKQLGHRPQTPDSGVESEIDEGLEMAMPQYDKSESANEGAQGNAIQPIPTASSKQGVSFELSTASKRANEAFQYLREKNFDEAIRAYREAAELDPRYQDALQRTERFQQEVGQVGFEKAKKQKVYFDQDITFQQLYGWD